MAATRKDYLKHHCLNVHEMEEDEFEEKFKESQIDEKPFKCPKCHYKAARKSHLKDHANRRHGLSSAEVDNLIASGSN